MRGGRLPTWAMVRMRVVAPHQKKLAGPLPVSPRSLRPPRLLGGTRAALTNPCPPGCHPPHRGVPRTAGCPCGKWQTGSGGVSAESSKGLSCGSVQAVGGAASWQAQWARVAGVAGQARQGGWRCRAGGGAHCGSR